MAGDYLYPEGNRQYKMDVVVNKAVKTVFNHVNSPMMYSTFNWHEANATSLIAPAYSFFYFIMNLYNIS